MNVTVRKTLADPSTWRGVALSRPGVNILVRQPAFWLAALTLALTLIPAARLVRLNNDSTEFYDVARRLLAGEGYRLGVKAYHFGGTEVLHNALDERAPFYPLFVAAFLRIGLGLPALQVANAVFAAICAALVYAIGTALFGRRIGVLAGLLAATSPIVLSYLVPPMSEAPATFLLLLAAWLLVRNPEAPSVSAFAAAGAALGLGYLTRATTPLLGATLVLGVVVASGHRRALLRPLAALGLAGAVFVIPITLYSLATRGIPSYSQSWMYSVYDYTSHQELSHRPLPSALDFIRSNFSFVVGASLENSRAFGEKLFLDPKWLLPLAPAWPAALVAVGRGRYPRAALPILLLAAANFFVYALTWSVHDRRYQVPVMLLLLPIAVDGLDRLGLARIRPWSGARVTALHLAVLAVVLLWSPALLGDYRTSLFPDSRTTRSRLEDGLRWDALASWLDNVDKADPRDFRQVLEWVANSTQRDDVVAHGFPWPFTFFTERPATLLPAHLEADQLRAFVADYHIAYVVVSRQDPARRYTDDLEALESDGLRRVEVHGYRIYDTRALWRG